MEKRSLLDQLVHGVADAIGDVREKLVEEGWFGRSSAPASVDTSATIAPPIQPATVSRTHIDLDINQSVNVGTINIDMRQQTSTSPMRSWDDICANVGPVRGNEPEPEHERGLDR